MHSVCNFINPAAQEIILIYNNTLSCMVSSNIPSFCGNKPVTEILSHFVQNMKLPY
jgi:hypothetical protein